MYKYAETRNRAHRVHTDGGQAWKVEQCNLDDAKYFGLLDEPPAKPRCFYCWVEPAVEEQIEKTAEKVPAVAKSQMPKSLIMISRRVMVLLLLLVAFFALLTGNASGVVLSPDLEIPEPTPDWESRIWEIVDLRILEHIDLDHFDDHSHDAPEVTPSASPIPTPSSTTTSTPSPTGTSSTPRPTTRPSSTTKPRKSPSPTSTTAPTAKPSQVPSPTCFRPGEAVGNPDDCKWPHQP